MSNHLRRLRKLEAQLIDDSGLVPHSPQWYEHYRDKFRRYMAGDESAILRPMPLELLRRFMRECDEDGLRV